MPNLFLALRMFIVVDLVSWINYSRPTPHGFSIFFKKKIIVRMWDQRVDVAYIGSKCFTTHYFVCFPQLYPMNNLYRKVCSKKKPICKGSKLDSSEPQRDVLLSNVAKAVSSDI
jgi:hypothetical protein